MPNQSIPTAFKPLSEKTTGAIAGLKTHGESLGVTHNTAPIVQKDLDAATTANAAFEACKEESAKVLYPDFRDKDAQGRKFVGRAKKVLAVHLGDEWNERWVAAGFTGETIQTPSTAPGRETLLNDLATYFAAHPELESADFGVSAKRAGELHAALAAARAKVDALPDRRKAARIQRDNACAALRRRLRAMIAELELYLERNSILWADFGLTAPALMAPGRPKGKSSKSNKPATSARPTTPTDSSSNPEGVALAK